MCSSGVIFWSNTITEDTHSPSEIFKAPQTLISDEKLGSLCISASENATRVQFADSLPNLLVNSAMACSRWHTTFEFNFSSYSLLSSLWFWSLIFFIPNPKPKLIPEVHLSWMHHSVMRSGWFADHFLFSSVYSKTQEALPHSPAFTLYFC